MDINPASKDHNKIRILQVTPFYPPHIGGIEFVVETLSDMFVNDGHKVTIYTSNVPKVKSHEIIRNIEIYRFRSQIMPLGNPLPIGLLSKLMNKEVFDVVHVHDHYFFTSNMSLLCNIFKKRPLILTSHGIANYTGIKGVLESVYHKTLGNWSLRSPDKIIALCSSQANALLKLGADPNKIVIIPNGVHLRQINVDADTQFFKHALGLEGRKVILFAGSLIPRKGLTYLINAISHLKSKPMLLVAGDEPTGQKGYKKNLLQMVKEKGLEKDVIFLGWCSKPKIELAYVASDLFILPSLGEGLPLVLLEAMAYRKGIIATNIPGNSDIIKDGETGLLFEQSNYLELAEKIDYLLNNEGLCQRLGTNARKEIEKSYTWEIVFENILSLYKKVIGDG